MRRFLLALGLTVGMLVLTPSPSWACSCAIDRSATARLMRLAGTVAAGRVEWTSTDGQTRTYEVAVDSVYKGAAATSEKVVTSAQSSACGLGDLAPGKRYLFFIAGKHPGAMHIDTCSGTTAYDEAVARRVESITGPPGRPLSARDARGDDETSAGGLRSRPVVLGGAAVAILAIATGVLVAVRRRAGRSG